MVLEGHGVSPQLFADMHDMRREFFALPHWQKMAQKMPPDRYRGYALPGEHVTLKIMKHRQHKLESAAE